MKELEILLNSKQLLWFTGTFVFIFGLLFGSFLNVCIYRIPIGKSIVFPPSSCTKCNHQIRWYENIPVFSWIFLRGKCSGCGEKISLIYPVIELLNAVLYLFVFLKYGFSWQIFCAFYFVSALVVTGVIDYKTQYVYSKVILPVILLGLLWSWLEPSMGFQNSLLGIGLGAGVLLFVILAFYIVTRKIGMGLGDVYILAAIGAFVGPMKIPLVLLIASLLGILGFFFGKVVFKKKRIAENVTAEDLHTKNEKDLENAIYFGPFLAFAGILVFLLPNELLNKIIFLG